MSQRKPRKTVKFFNVNTDSTSMSGVLRKIQSSLEKNHKIVITTPNPEIVLQSLDDELLMKAINDSDIKVPDGIGLAGGAKFLRMKRYKNPVLKPIVYFFQGIYVGFDMLIDPDSLKNDLNIIKGRVLFIELIKIANKKKWKVYLLGGKEDASCKARDELIKNYKSVIIECSDGPLLDRNGKPMDKTQLQVEKKLIAELNTFQPQLLFVGFGAPKQEKWILRWKENLDVGAFMVVGGTFDYYAGNLKFPPNWINNRGLEWMWRLLMQPSRVFRIFNAVVKFSWKVYLFKLDQK